MAVVGLAGKPVVAAGMAEVVIGTVVAGIMLVLAGIGVTGTAATGTAVTGMVGAVAGIMVVTAAVGELAPRLASVLVLACSEERWQRLLITVVTTTATITRRMPVHPRQRFGIGAMPIRAITLRYPNARFLGDKLFSNSRKVLARLAGRETVIQPSDSTRLGSSY
jgi:hypothetical protein